MLGLRVVDMYDPKMSVAIVSECLDVLRQIYSTLVWSVSNPEEAKKQIGSVPEDRSKDLLLMKDISEITMKAVTAVSHATKAMHDIFNTKDDSIRIEMYKTTIKQIEDFRKEMEDFAQNLSPKYSGPYRKLGPFNFGIN